MKPSTLPSFVGFTTVAAVTAASAAGTSLALGFPPWAMFIGWVAYFTRGANARDGVINFGCVLLGLIFGILAAHGIGLLSPAVGAFALSIAVFVVAMVVVSLRAIPALNNILCYFLGLIAFVAAHQPPSITTFLVLGGAVAIGSTAGWISHTIQHRLTLAR